MGNRIKPLLRWRWKRYTKLDEKTLETLITEVGEKIDKCHETLRDHRPKSYNEYIEKNFVPLHEKAYCLEIALGFLKAKKCLAYRRGKDHKCLVFQHSCREAYSFFNQCVNCRLVEKEKLGIILRQKLGGN